jgi:hypothetical protein
MEQKVRKFFESVLGLDVPPAKQVVEGTSNLEIKEIKEKPSKTTAESSIDKNPPVHLTIAEEKRR